MKVKLNSELKEYVYEVWENTAGLNEKEKLNFVSYAVIVKIVIEKKTHYRLICSNFSIKDLLTSKIVINSFEFSEIYLEKLLVADTKVSVEKLYVIFELDENKIKNWKTIDVNEDYKQFTDFAEKSKKNLFGSGFLEGLEFFYPSRHLQLEEIGGIKNIIFRIGRFSLGDNSEKKMLTINSKKEKSLLKYNNLIVECTSSKKKEEGAPAFIKFDDFYIFVGLLESSLQDKFEDNSKKLSYRLNFGIRELKCGFSSNNFFNYDPNVRIKKDCMYHLELNEVSYSAFVFQQGGKKYYSCINKILESGQSSSDERYKQLEKLTENIEAKDCTQLDGIALIDESHLGTEVFYLDYSIDDKSASSVRFLRFGKIAAVNNKNEEKNFLITCFTPKVRKNCPVFILNTLKSKLHLTWIGMTNENWITSNNIGIGNESFRISRNSGLLQISPINQVEDYDKLKFEEIEIPKPELNYNAKKDFSCSIQGLDFINEVVHWGSGFFFYHENKMYLITAGHVIHKKNEKFFFDSIKLPKNNWQYKAYDFKIVYTNKNTGGNKSFLGSSEFKKIYFLEHVDVVMLELKQNNEIYDNLNYFTEKDFCAIDDLSYYDELLVNGFVTHYDKRHRVYHYGKLLDYRMVNGVSTIISQNFAAEGTSGSMVLNIANDEIKLAGIGTSGYYNFKNTLNIKTKDVSNIPVSPAGIHFTVYIEILLEILKGNNL